MKELLPVAFATLIRGLAARTLLPPNGAQPPVATGGESESAGKTGGRALPGRKIC
jgi:hypothetical protein